MNIIISGFFSRLFYIVSLVWESSPAVLVWMAVFCVLNGVLPVIGAYISKELLNGIAALIGGEHVASAIADVFNILRPVLFLLLLEFIYLFIKRILDRLNAGVTAVAGELVVNHIKLKIIKKAKTVDTCSFDSPEFYEKLENANREAGMRPIGILSATFNVISAIISVVSFIVVLATLSPWAPVIIVLTALPGAIVNYVYRHKNFRYMRHHSKDRREMNYFSGLMTNKDRVKEIKVLDLGDTFIEKYESAWKRYFKGLKTLILRENVLRVIVSLLATFANCALFAYVAYDVVFNGGLIGDYSLYTGALNSVSSYVTTLVTSTATIYLIQSMLITLGEVYGSVPQPQVTGILDLPTGEALSAFQYLSALPQTGEVDKITWKHLALQYPLAVNHAKTTNRIRR